MNYLTSTEPGANSRQLFTIFMISVASIAMFLIVLQEIGTPATFLVYMAFAFLALTYPIVAILSRTMNLDEYQVAGRRSVPRFVGMGIAAATISGGVFIGQSGEIFTSGYRGLISLSGIFLGLAFVTILFAPAIGAAKTATLSGMFAGRHNSVTPRLTMMICTIIVSFILLISQLSLARKISETFFEIPGEAVLVVGLFVVVVCMVMGGMRALTWIRAGLYVVIAASFILPIAWVSATESGFTIPHLSFGFGALEPLSSMSLRFSANGASFAAGMQPDVMQIPAGFEAQSIYSDIVLLLVIATCIASMPHILQHFLSVRSASHARTSGMWAIGLSVLVLGAVPAYAAFMKMVILNNVPGNLVGEIEAIAPWIFEYGQIFGQPLVTICGSAVQSTESIIAACGNGETYRLLPSDIYVSPFMITLGSAAISNLAPLFSILLGVGILAAIFSTVDGLLLVIANCLSHDALYRALGSRPAIGPRIFSARLLLVMFAIIAAGLSLRFELPPLQMAGAALAISGATFFMPLILRIYMPHCTGAAASLGMIAGLLVSFGDIFMRVFGLDLKLQSGDEMTYLSGVFASEFDLFHATLLGLAASTIVIVVISTLQKATSRKPSSMKNRPLDNEPQGRPDIA